METATTFPGNTGVRPQSITPMAEVLRQNGFSTAAFGKYHETPPWEISVSGSLDRWPTHSGFDKFYGFIGGETNQWAPLVYDGVTQVEVPENPNYHFTTDMTDQAISGHAFNRRLHQKNLSSFILPQVQPRATPCPKEWIDKYKGKFDQGWDKMREETLARQKKLVLFPPIPNLPQNLQTSKIGNRFLPMRRKCFQDRWKPTLALLRIPITKLGGLFLPLKTWENWTTL